MEDDFGAIDPFMLEALAEHLGLALLLWLVVEIEHFGRLARLALLLRLWCTYALRLQRLPI